MKVCKATPPSYKFKRVYRATKSQVHTCRSLREANAVCESLKGAEGSRAHGEDGKGHHPLGAADGEEHIVLDVFACRQKRSLYGHKLKLYSTSDAWLFVDEDLKMQLESTETGCP